MSDAYTRLLDSYRVAYDQNYHLRAEIGRLRAAISAAVEGTGGCPQCDAVSDRLTAALRGGES